MPFNNKWTNSPAVRGGFLLIGSESGLTELNGALKPPIGSESELTEQNEALKNPIGSDSELTELNGALKPPIGSESELTKKCRNLTAV
jgi:hypothetical protein